MTRFLQRTFQIIIHTFLIMRRYEVSITDSVSKQSTDRQKHKQTITAILHLLAPEFYI
jgi:hypothetical protein